MAALKHREFRPFGMSAAIHRLVFPLIAVFVGLTASFILLEVVFRLLPTSDSLKTQAVDESRPYLHFQPNRELTLSRGKFFEIVSRKRSNNAGFLSDLDYVSDGKSKFIVIGDSFVEAVQVSNRDSIHGRLNSLSPDKPVYGIGSSGSALSQYLAYARYAMNEFSPSGLCFVIIGNDFDESLLEYKDAPGFHYFRQREDTFDTVRVDYAPSPGKELLKLSALVRYLYLNVQLENVRLPGLARRELPGGTYFVGNFAKNVDSARIEKSKRAIDYFLSETEKVAKGIPVVFVLDAPRPNLYSAAGLLEAQGSYFAIMRSYFKEKAESYKFEVIDMEPVFTEHFRKNGQKFEYEIDAHWNELGHSLAADSVSRSQAFHKFRASQPGFR